MSRSHALQDKLIVLAGGSGFLGAQVAQALLDAGARVRVASRHPEKAFGLKPLAALGQLQFARVDIGNHEAARAVVAGAHGVVNLVGAFDGDIRKLMGEDAGVLAQAAKAAGAQAFVQISGIGADEASEIGYQHAKGLGERLVREAFPSATILRPSILFGEDDDFVNRFAGLIATLPVLPVFAPDVSLQPLFVADCAAAVEQALADPARHGGKTFELGGPEQMTMMQINQAIAEGQNRDRHFIAMPDGASALFAALPLTPMSRDQWAMLKQGNAPSGDLSGFKQMGIVPRPLSLFLDKWMVRYRKHGRFGVRTVPMPSSR